MAKKKQNDQQKANITNEPKARETVVAIPNSQPIDNTTYYLIASLLMMVVFAIIRYNFLEIPFERDEGSYGYIGQLLLDGKKPYLDFYEMKPPALYYSYAVLVGIFGASTAGLHAGILVVCMLTAAMIYQICKVLFHRDGALLAMLTYLQISLSQMVTGFTAQAEHLVIFNVVAGFYFLSRAYQQGKIWQWILAGAFLCNAVMTKQVAAVFGPAAIALAWAGARHLFPENILKKTLMNVLLIGVGAALVAGAWLGLVAANGAWDRMMFWLFEYPKSYTTAFTWEARKGEFWSMIGGLFKFHNLTLVVALSGLVMSLVFRKYLNMWLVNWLFFLGSLAAVFPGYYFYSHYWMYLAPALAFCAAAALSEVREKLSSSWIVGAVVITLVFLVDIAKQKSYYFSPNLKEIMYTNYNRNPFPELDAIGKYIKKKAQPQDQLIVMGSEPQLNFTTGLRSPTKHFFMGYLTKGRPEEEAWIQEAKRDIETAKPRFCVFVVHPYSWAYTDNKKTEMFDFANSFPQQDYTLIGMTDLLKGGTKYLWDNEARAYPKPAPGNMYILTYERKPDGPAGQ